MDYCDEEAGRKELSSPTFDLQWHVSSVVLLIAVFVHTSTVALVTTEAFSQNVIFLAQHLCLGSFTTFMTTV